MTTTSRERAFPQRLGRVGDRRARDTEESRRFDASDQVLEAARQLERSAGPPTSARGAGASFGHRNAVVEATSNANALIGDVARVELAGVTACEPDRLQQLRRPLFIVDQSLRFVAGACNLGRELVASIQGHH